MKLKLSLPYMGSKRKLAEKIVNKIIEDNPKTKYFYDLFGGGGAVSFCALQIKQIKRVIYNELNTGVVELLKDIRKNGITDKYFQWVDRETFMKHKYDDDWFGGLCKVVWSFGNGQKSYLFGKHIEHQKHLAHKIVVDKDEQALKELSDIIGIKIPHSMIEEINLLPKTIHQRRLELQRFIKINKDRFELERLQRLQQLERLEQLQQLEQLQRLEIQNKSYEEVIINTPLEETIIYLDPPYKGTGIYQEQLNHGKLKEWIHSSKYKIYVSGYENVYGLKEVLSIKHNTKMSSTTNNKIVEKIFVN